MFIVTTASNLTDYFQELGSLIADGFYLLEMGSVYVYQFCFQEIGPDSRRLVLFRGDWFCFQFRLVLFQKIGLISIRLFYFKEIGSISRRLVSFQEHLFFFKRLVLFLDDWFYFKEIGSTSISRRLILFQKDLFYFQEIGSVSRLLVVSWRLILFLRICWTGSRRFVLFLGDLFCFKKIGSISW